MLPASCGLHPGLYLGDRSTAMGPINLPADHFAHAYLAASQMGMGGALGHWPAPGGWCPSSTDHHPGPPIMLGQPDEPPIMFGHPPWLPPIHGQPDEPPIMFGHPPWLPPIMPG